MKTFAALFFSSKYWTDPAARAAAAEEILGKLDADASAIVVDGALPPDAYAGYDTLLAVPCSGSVQPCIAELSRHFAHVILFAAYVHGNFSDALCDAMLQRNAAPTLMDCFGVLRRDRDVCIAKNFAALRQNLRVCAALDAVRRGKILLVGEVEPWVISVPRDFAVYKERLGVTIEAVPHEDLIGLYEAVTPEEALPITEYFSDARACIEPTEADILRCARMALAMQRLLDAHAADGMAIACFHLIGRLGVNPCLGVSWLNGETPCFAACEGDPDSAVTMLMLRALTEEKPWMANPCLQADDTVNFAHCTAPLRVHGEKRPYILHNHHETGVGASPQVLYEIGEPLSMFRYSAVNHAMSIHRGVIVPGRYEPNCRTQMCVRPENYENWISAVQGCHQVLTFGDITADVAALCARLGVRTLG